jgi:hypothetical protein
MTVKYKAAFKKDTREYDGLDHEPTRKAIISNPLQRIYAVVALDVAKVENMVEQGGALVPQMKIVHIEPQEGDNLIVVREMLDASYRARTGQPGGAQPSLFDQDDPQANADAEHVGNILHGALPFVEPPAPPERDTSDDDQPPADDDKPKRRRS